MDGQNQSCPGGAPPALSVVAAPTGGSNESESGRQAARSFSVSSTSSSPRDPFQSLPSPGTPSPLSPQPVPSPQSPLSSPDTVHDLPAELLRAGWRKFFSKRENRHYFFNKYNNESRWEAPTLPSAAKGVMPSPASLDMSPDPLRDPLGISSPTPSSGSSDSIHVGEKRKSTDSLDLGGTPHKPPTIKRTYKGPTFYNVDIHSNVIMYERPLVSTLLPPHPDIERERHSMMQKLRLSYRELCHSREGVEPPRESFTRWLLERTVCDKGGDPLFPSDCPGEVSPSMFKEIMGNIPVKLGRARNRNDARQFLSQYADAAKKMADSRDIPKESRKLIKWHVDDVMNWLRNQQSANYDDYINRLTHLTRECQPHIQKAAKPSVEGICSKVYHHSVEFAKKIRDKHVALLRDHNIKVSAPDPDACPHERRVMCYPLQLATPTPRLPVPELFQEGNKTCLRYKGETVSILTHYFHKLEDLYRVNCKDDPRFDFYLARVFSLLKRYQTFFGSDGAAQQVALPVTVFEALHETFGVTFELFASPLNCFFKQFCSKFGDTDSCFGSRGNLFDFHPLSGSFEANPPFSEELMSAMVDHLENVLSESDDPLSVIIFIPEWREPTPDALVKLENSRFKQKQIVIPKNEHEYRHGYQHVVPDDELNQRCFAHGTVVIWLQNDAGFSKWGPDSERVKKLTNAFRPRPRERHHSNVDSGPQSSSSNTSTASSSGSEVNLRNHDNRNSTDRKESPRSRDILQRSHSYSSSLMERPSPGRRHQSSSDSTSSSFSDQPQNKMSKYSS